MSKRPPFSVQYLKSILSYDPKTGIFTWLWRDDYLLNWNRKWAGKEAGTDNLGYRMITINRKIYRAHTLAWFYMTGRWPLEVDHINRVRNCNVWGNLRDCTHSLNSFNAARRRTNTSGYSGVSFRPQRGTWRARINVDNKEICLGHFADLAEAVAVRRAAELRYFGEVKD